MRRHLSFGDEGESIIDVMEQAEIEAHDRGQHDGEHDTCPVCNGEVDRGDGVQTDGGEVPEETHIGEDGLWIPPALREFDRQIIIRTPSNTQQVFSSDGEIGPYYGMVRAEDFGEPEEFYDAKNPDLAPDKVTIKPQGEDAVTLTVDVEPEVRADGGTRGDDTRHLQPDDRLLDAQNDDDDAYVRVVTPRPDTRVDQHVVYETDDGTEQTVYDYHRGEVPASDSVVDVVYEESLEAAFGDADAMPRADILDFLRTYAIDSFVANGSKVTVYSFPRSRLERVSEACAECEADAADFMSGAGDEAGGNGGEQR